MNAKPWDARLAAWLVRPLVDSWVHPNILTSVRLLVGLVGASLLAAGAFNLGALFVVASNFLDHTDGELARMSGKTSQFGHRYDLTSDAVVTVGLFVGLGFGLAPELGLRAITYGAISGVAVAGIFQLRHLIEREHGKSATKQKTVGGFETEDILYLFPLVTLSGQHPGFLSMAAIGAPLALVVVVIQFLSLPRSAPDES